MTQSPPSSRKPKTPPHIFVACDTVSRTNVQHGVWIDATQSPVTLLEQVTALLQSSPATPQGWFIPKSAGFYGIDIPVDQSLATVHLLARLVQEHGELGALVYRYYASPCCCHETRHRLHVDANLIVIAEGTLTENYIGCYPSRAAFAQDWYKDYGRALSMQHRFGQAERILEKDSNIFMIELGDEVHAFLNGNWRFICQG